MRHRGIKGTSVLKHFKVFLHIYRFLKNDQPLSICFRTYLPFFPILSPWRNSTKVVTVAPLPKFIVFILLIFPVLFVLREQPINGQYFFTYYGNRCYENT